MVDSAVVTVGMNRFGKKPLLNTLNVKWRPSYSVQAKEKGALGLLLHFGHVSSLTYITSILSGSDQS